MKKGRRGRAALSLLALLGAAALPVHGSCMDLSLEDAVALALSQNTELRITQKGEETADAALREAKGQNGFSVTALDGLNTGKSEGQDRSDKNNLSLSGSLPVYSGGKNEANIESSELGVDSALLKTERAREDLKLSVVKAYYDALESKKEIAVDQESVDNYQAHLTNVQQLYSAGSKARIDVLRSEVELSNAQQTLIKAENAYEVDLATLRNYINVDRSEPLNLTTDFSYELFSAGLDDTIGAAMLNRKDLKIAEIEVAQKELALKAAKAGYLPSVNLSVGLGEATNFNPDSDSSGSWSAGASVNWNIFDSGVTRAQVDSARTALDVSKLTLKKDQEDVDLSVRQSYYNMREAEKRFKSTSDAVAKAEEDYYIAREKYRAGEGLMLDIIDAQLALSTAKLNYISAEYDYARYKAEVENGMGQGLTESEREAAARLLLLDEEE